MSFGFSLPLGASRLRRLLQVGGLVGALAMTGVVAGGAALAVAALGALGWAAWDLRATPKAKALAGGSTGMAVSFADADFPFQVDEVLVTPLLVVFSGRVPERSSKRISVAVWRDAVSADGFRRLRVYAQWLAAGAQGESVSA